MPAFDIILTYTGLALLTAYFFVKPYNTPFLGQLKAKGVLLWSVASMLASALVLLIIGTPSIHTVIDSMVAGIIFAAMAVALKVFKVDFEVGLLFTFSLVWDSASNFNHPLGWIISIALTLALIVPIVNQIKDNVEQETQVLEDA